MIDKMLTTLIILLLAVLLLGHPTTRADTRNERILNCEDYGTDDVVQLACNIYFEARGEGQVGKYMVAFATMNRVDSKHYPDTFAEVVREIRTDARTKKRVAMFSWTLDGKPDWVTDEKSWISSLLIASRIVGEHKGLYTGTKTRDFTYGCMWYHHIGITPDWKDDYHPTVRIKNHQCYTINERVFLKKLSELLPSE